jgi:hypothetical protein
VRLRVDHEHTGGSDDDVVDVAPGPWHSTIVEDAKLGNLRELGPSFSSPAAPIAQARVDCGSELTARTTLAAKPVPHRSVIRALRLAARRSCSVRAERPATPGSTAGKTAAGDGIGSTDGEPEQSMQWIVLVARSQTAGVPRTRAIPQRTHVPSYLTRHSAMSTPPVGDPDDP